MSESRRAADRKRKLRDYRANAEAINARRREVWAADPDKRARNYARCKAWRANNRERARAKDKERLADPMARTTHRIRCAVNDAIRRGGGEKNQITADIIGRTPADVAAQMVAAGYRKGMHIDHIIPFAVLRVRYPNDERRVQREAWKACNLRVIPAKENCAKGARREFLI